MQFTFRQTRDDGGGSLTITAQSSKEVIELRRCYRRHNQDDPESLIEYARAIESGHFEVTLDSEKRPHYRISGVLPERFLKPYIDALKRLTGYAGPIPDANLTPYCDDRFSATHCVDSLQVKSGEIHFQVFVDSEPWAGLTAVQYAERRAIDLVNEDFGYRPLCREYIENGNGTYQRNPDYPRHMPASPALSCEWFWNWLFSWWVESFATPGQIEIMKQHEPCSKYGNAWGLSTNGTSHWIQDSRGIYCVRDDGDILYFGADGPKVKYITWEEFQNA